MKGWPVCILSTPFLRADGSFTLQPAAFLHCLLHCSFHAFYLCDMHVFPDRVVERQVFYLLMTSNKTMRVVEIAVGLLVLVVCSIPIGKTILIAEMLPHNALRYLILGLLMVIMVKLLANYPRDYYRFFKKALHRMPGYKPAKSNRAYRR